MPFFFDIALPASFFGVMFLLGLSLQWSDFQAIGKYPKALVLGLLSQMLILPLLAYALISFYPMPETLQVGFILLAACPGGSTSNLASYMMRGNVALSVSLTVLNSFLVIFTVPLIMGLAGKFLAFQHAEIALPFWKTVGEISLLTLVPVVAGLLFRRKYSVTATKIERIFKFLMPGLMAASIAGGALFGPKTGAGAGMENYLSALWPALILNVGSMCVGFLLALLAGLSHRDRFTIAIEVGIQNSALAITIATGTLFLNNAAMAIPAIMYLLFPFFTALAFAYLANRKNLRGALFRSSRPPRDS